MNDRNIDEEFKKIQLNLGYQITVETLEKIENLAKAHMVNHVEGCECGTLLSDLKPNSCPGVLGFYAVKKFTENLTTDQINSVFIIALTRYVNYYIKTSKLESDLKMAHSALNEITKERNTWARQQADLYDEINTLKDQIEDMRDRLTTMSNERDRLTDHLAELTGEEQT